MHPQATEDHTSDDIEDVIGDLTAAARLLGHMACSGLEVGSDEVDVVQRIIMKARDALRSRQAAP